MAAVAAVRDGEKIKTAARNFCVPRSTLQRYLKGQPKSTFGPNPILSDNEEESLVNWLIDLSKKGFPRRREDVQLSVQEFLKSNERKTPFKDNLPGIGWYKAFLRRHPVLSERTSETVTKASANISEADIRRWFKEIETYLKSENLFDILQDPSRVFNGDETNFQLCPKNQKVIAPRGSKNVYEVSMGNEKETLRVMFTFGADGSVCPPMIVYNYKRLPNEIVQSVPDSWGIGCSDSGWMRSEVFFEFVANVLHPHLVKTHVKFPVILFVDGHKSHLTFQLSELCTELQIILIALYPNATRILQPADVAVFQPVKSEWKKGVLNWRREHPSEALTRKDFAPVLEKIVNERIKPETLKSGFRACGLVPWNPDNIDFTKCIGRKYSVATPTDINKNVNNSDEKNKLLAFQKFCSIVGEERIEQFKNIEKVTEEEHSEEFFVLYRLYEEFFERNDQNSEFDGQDVEQQTRETNLEQTALENVYVEQEQPTLSTAPLHMNESPQPRTPSSSSVLKRSDVKSLEDCLVWPETPKRKNLRNVQRMPYVITSKQWKDIHKEKADTKANEERKKEDRKRKREEKNFQINKNERGNKKRKDILPVIRESNDPKMTAATSVKKVLLFENRNEQSGERNHGDEHLKQNTESLAERKGVADCEQGSTSTNILSTGEMKMGRCFFGASTSNFLLESKTNNSLRKSAEIFSSGLCFQCGGSLNTKIQGVSCQICQKIFHKKCLPVGNDLHPAENESEDENIFFCINCLDIVDYSGSD
ncbi:uncharacterized protein [Anabrus simplex]|uniref:uncharacterized protein n=1 Tax=Anabrus simplex TaxID=316456 RepID=UPI0035A34AD0